MKKHIRTFVLLVALAVCFTGCNNVEDANNNEIEENNYPSITNEETNNVNAFSDENVDELFDAYLNGKTTVDLNGESINISSYSDDVQYVKMDVDSDGTDELCVRALPSFYILKAENGGLNVIYSGATYDEPINNDDIVGVYWYRSGAAPTHSDYKVVSFKENGDVDEIIYYSWYDENGNSEMDVDDSYSKSYLNENINLDMQDWLDTAQVCIDNQDYHADWIDLNL